MRASGVPFLSNDRFVHAEAPGKEKAPFSHSIHALEDFEPLDDVYVPATQALHAEAPAAFEYFPAKHNTQASEPEAPTVVEKLPAEQPTQNSQPYEEYVPIMHKMQFVAP